MKTWKQGIRDTKTQKTKNQRHREIEKKAEKQEGATWRKRESEKEIKDKPKK